MLLLLLLVSTISSIPTVINIINHKFEERGSRSGLECNVSRATITAIPLGNDSTECSDRMLLFHAV